MGHLTPPERPGDDLEAAVLTEVLGDRPLRSYPALLSTEADALAWARAGGPSGAVVVADYQASPRGRGGTPWRVSPGTGLGFSLVLRPDLPVDREGWLYVAAATGLADVVGEQAFTVWPDEVRDGASVAASLGVYVELGPTAVAWAVATVLVPAAAPPRGRCLSTLVDAIERRVAAPAEEVLPAYVERCGTLGREVRARMIPMGPSGPQVAGRAVEVRTDGALVLLTEAGRRVRVHPQNLGLLEDADLSR